MPIEILMPALSPTMTEGNVSKWLKREGEEVHSGDVLAEIETDKATMEFEAVDDGRLGKILVPEGAQGIKVNQPIALLLGEGEDAAALEKLNVPAPKAVPTPPPEQAPAQAQPAPEAQAQPSPARGNGRIFASPLARRMAQQAGLELAAIAGSGPQGRVVKADIEAALSAERAAPAPARPADQPPPAPSVAPAGATGPVQGASAGSRRQSAPHRATAHGDAPRHRQAADGIKANGPAFLSDHRLRDRSGSEESGRPCGFARPVRIIAAAPSVLSYPHPELRVRTSRTAASGNASD